MIFKNIFTKSFNLINKNVPKFTSNFSSLSLKSAPTVLQTNTNLPQLSIQSQPRFEHSKCTITTSVPNYDLMEFFETKENMSEETIKHGRPWKLEELRIKGNTDLHKLWYILHKERNMLLTMENMYKKEGEPFPSPERIAKVGCQINDYKICYLIDD